MKRFLISLTVLLSLGAVFPQIAAAKTEIVVIKQRVTGLTIIELWEDGELVASDVVRN